MHEEVDYYTSHLGFNMTEKSKRATINWIDGGMNESLVQHPQAKHELMLLSLMETGKQAFIKNISKQLT